MSDNKLYEVHILTPNVVPGCPQWKAAGELREANGRVVPAFRFTLADAETWIARVLAPGMTTKLVEVGEVDSAPEDEPATPAEPMMSPRMVKDFMDNVLAHLAVDVSDASKVAGKPAAREALEEVCDSIHDVRWKLSDYLRRAVESGGHDRSQVDLSPYATVEHLDLFMQKVFEGIGERFEQEAARLRWNSYEQNWLRRIGKVLADTCKGPADETKPGMTEV